MTKIGSGFGYLEEIPLAKGKRCYSVNGFSLHCNTSINTHARDRLEKLIEYIARGPLSNERLEITSDGKIKLQLKSSWNDGTTHLLFTPGEFLEKLAAIIPPPKSHLVRWRVCRAGEGECSPAIHSLGRRPQIRAHFDKYHSPEHQSKT